ncbi:hypothetical protein [Portibacter marinus]|uniref:hypothetical protein n=1 Tax=Portibacter marinus TaxID=2898660 RepID=UPI001F382A62|nr:hypothetical protein [Portibacter marinus]
MKDSKCIKEKAFARKFLLLKQLIIVTILLVSLSFQFQLYGQVNPKAEVQGDLQVTGRVTQLELPTQDQHVVTKAYMDDLLIGFGIQMGDDGIQNLLKIGYDPIDLIERGVSPTSFPGKQYGGGTIVIQNQDGSGMVAQFAYSQNNNTISWGCQGQNIPGATGTAIGTGPQNTAAIIGACNEMNIAARLAGNFVNDGYNDWFLPSRDELNRIAVVLQFGAITGDKTWTSSQVDAFDAYSMNTGFMMESTRKQANGGIMVARNY